MMAQKIPRAQTVETGDLEMLEELWRFGKKEHVCPYFLARESACVQQANVIFMLLLLGGAGSCSTGSMSSVVVSGMVRTFFWAAYMFSTHLNFFGACGY